MSRNNFKDASDEAQFICIQKDFCITAAVFFYAPCFPTGTKKVTHNWTLIFVAVKSAVII